MTPRRRWSPSPARGGGPRTSLLLCLLLLAACDEGGKDGTGERPEADADTDSDADSDVDTGSLPPIDCDETPAEVSLLDAKAILLGEDSVDYAGWSVAGPGDVNGDGFDDILVGAPRYWDRTSYIGSIGAAYLVLGPVSGMFDLGGAEAVVYGTHGEDEVGVSVDGGDMDGDGYADLLIEASGPDPDRGKEEGAVFLFRGPVSGSLLWNRADGMISLNAPPTWGGSGFSYLGDVDGDGLGDVLINDPGAEEWSASGSLWLVSGFVGDRISLPDDADAGILGSESQQVGWKSAAAGDVNGDGYDDALVGAINPWAKSDSDDPRYGVGATWLFTGPISGALTGADATFTATGVDRAEGAWLTHGAADLDDDGFLDIAVASTHADDYADSGGAIWVFAGPHAGSVTVDDADWAIFGTEDSAMIGYDADLADLDGDGLADILGGATNYSTQAVRLFRGPLQHVAAWDCADIAFTNDWLTSYGTADVLLGDIDADGYPDFAIGSDTDWYWGVGTTYVFGVDQLLPAVR